MPVMAFLLLVFAMAIGIATFVEDIHGTLAARAVIYSAKWFEFIMLWLSMNLIYNVFKGKLYLRSKFPVFLFHISFIVIIIGAGLTRYIGKDGIMQIREGTSTNVVTSSDTFFKVIFAENNEYASHKEMVRISPISQKDLKSRVSFKDSRFTFRSRAYLQGVTPSIKEVDDGKRMIDIMVSVGNVRQSFIIEEGNSLTFNRTKFHFGNNADADINFVYDDSLLIRSTDELVQFNMISNIRDTLSTDSLHPLIPRILYENEKMRFVIRNFSNSGSTEYVTENSSMRNSFNVVEVEMDKDGSSSIIYLPVYTQSHSIIQHIPMSDLELELSFGNDYFKTPFYVYLEDFNVTRYTGSNSPSSFDSHVAVLDNNKNHLRDYHIYMNHILNQDGWRFYQNSYDEDELGTILSVTWDDWGIKITYLGYFLLSLGMILALFWKSTTFRFNLKKFYNFRKGGLVVLILLLSSKFIGAQEQASAPVSSIDEEIVQEFSTVWVADKNGRMKPVNTLFHELSRKLGGKNKLDGVPAQEALLGMLVYPEEWGKRSIIKIGNDQLKDTLKLEGKYATITDFFENKQNFNYKLRDMVNTAFRKAPHERSKFDNEVIAVDERINIFLMLQSGEFLRIFPDPKHPDETWYTPASNHSGLDQMDSMFMASAINLLSNSINDGAKEDALLLIDGIKRYQEKYAGHVLPSNSKNKLEVMYERSGIFSRLSLVYVGMALIVLLLVVIMVFTENKIVTRMLAFLHYVIWFLFLLQFAAIGIRWYITGHAPLSNGYEAMLYVSLAGLLVGLIMSYRNRILLFITAIFAAAPLFVAHLNLMNPELTNLVPVLKSYWLTIHVATITASYSVFGFAAFVAFINLMLMAFTSAKIKTRFNSVIDEFTYLNEILLTIGLYLITIGCFLGGIWANESWGTYWSWDPKETWALVAILVYAFVAHIKHIESLRSRYTFNVAMFLSYSTILMTYFGVNYFLGGMHSYGKGDAFNLSIGSYATIGFLVFTIFYAKYKESGKSD